MFDAAPAPSALLRCLLLLRSGLNASRSPPGFAQIRQRSPRPLLSRANPNGEERPPERHPLPSVNVLHLFAHASEGKRTR